MSRLSHPLILPFAVGSLCALTSVAGAEPVQVIHQGRLFDAAGDPITGESTVEFRLYAEPDDATWAWMETHANVVVDDGYYTVALGSNTPLEEARGYLGVTVDGGDEFVRQKLHEAGSPFEDVVCAAGETARRTASGWACGTARTPLGLLDIPVSYSGTPSSWSRINRDSYVSFDWSAYDAYIQQGQRLEARLCMTYTDSGTHSDRINVRLRSGTSGTTVFSDYFGNSWSGSGLIHSDCRGWQDASALAACASGAGGQCQMQANHSGNDYTIIYQMWWELSAAPVVN